MTHVIHLELLIENTVLLRQDRLASLSPEPFSFSLVKIMIFMIIII